VGGRNPESMSSELAIATTSPLAAKAAAEMARAGGNAVDAAIAAALISMNTEPGVCSLACGGYATIWPPGERPVTLDGYVAAPGKGNCIAESERNSVEVHMQYGGGITTVVGPDTVGVPGGIAMLSEASQRWGQLPWQTLFGPVIAATRDGFPLPQASYNYLVFSGEPVFDRAPDGRRALRHDDGSLREAGENIRVPHLSETLQRIAQHGAKEFYTGDSGRAMARYIQENGGRLNNEDLASYQVIERSSLVIRSGSWEVATNPPPAVGGSVLAAMLLMMSSEPVREWNAQTLAFLIETQQAVLGFRRDRLDLSTTMDDDVNELLKLAIQGNPAIILESGSTCHTSAVDATGLACSITLSAGYGSGDMPPETGIWLNNCLGELELNRRGLNIGPPGTRLPSNMAPTVATNNADGEVLAIGSPGADRITTAILQALVNHLHLGMPLAEAIEHPRAHVEFTNDACCVAYEVGLPVEKINAALRQFETASMYFGGVGAAAWNPATGFSVAADPRRTGGVWSNPC